MLSGILLSKIPALIKLIAAKISRELNVLSKMLPDQRVLNCLIRKIFLCYFHAASMGFRAQRVSGLHHFKKLH